MSKLNPPDKFEIHFESVEKRSVTAKMAQKMLAKNAIKLDTEKAKLVLNLIYKLSNLSVHQVLKGRSSSELFPPNEHKLSTPKIIKTPWPFTGLEHTRRPNLLILFQLQTHQNQYPFWVKNIEHSFFSKSRVKYLKITA